MFSGPFENILVGEGKGRGQSVILPDGKLWVFRGATYFKYLVIILAPSDRVKSFRMDD